MKDIADRPPNLSDLAVRFGSDKGPSEIAQVVATIGAVGIMNDDASHASHHQQVDRTAKLFRGFSERKEFVHSDPDTQAAFRELAPEISGCFLFQVQYTKTRRDQVAVIHKR